MPVILNVAEKPSVAKELARILCKNGYPTSTPGKSKYNCIYHFPCENAGQLGNNVDMRITSVTGHLLEMEFQAPYE